MHDFKKNRYRIQSDPKVAICSVHPSEQATLQCLGCVKAKIHVAKSYHCSPRGRAFGCFNTYGSGASNASLSGSTPSIGHNTSLSDGSTPSYPATVTERSGGETWFEVGRLKTYTPIANDIGHVPKFECVSFDAEKKLHVGHANTILTSHVIPPPTPCPSYCPSWAYRRQNLLREIVGYRADILCLQEDNVALIAVLEAKFSNHGADTPGKRQLLCVELCFFLRIHNGTWDLLREAFHLTQAAPIFLRSSLCFTPKHDSHVTPHFEYVIMRFADLFQKWCLYCLVFGILSMLFAHILSDWVPFYYSSSMAVGVLLVVLFLLFQNIEIHFEDWNIGILGHVVLHGVDQGRRDLTWQKWSYQVGLKGEAVNLVSKWDFISGMDAWVISYEKAATTYMSYCSAPNGEGPLALDMGFIGKGQVWINGHKVFNNASCYLLFKIMVQKLLLW
ncbi:hypothetical protein IFM89_038002 [Coptis chinensis]|uniref:Beta-galactosidase galactose-binding domain-containing protein n=1 Tax=Coptis chinensis TaxID=261450 RepID=A0A835LXN5_9MAGN|nr:hypothetical protein IFM89_038002 [Coptis chinensis]